MSAHAHTSSHSARCLQMLQNLGLLLVFISSLGPFLFAEGLEFGGYMCVYKYSLHTKRSLAVTATFIHIIQLDLEDDHMCALLAR